MTVDDLARFLTERYDEAEALAKAAAADGTPEWNLRDDPDPVIGASRIYDANGEVVVYDEGAPSPNEAEFIAANDPAHRLADIKLKRAILALHATYQTLEGNICRLCGGDGAWWGDDGAWCATVRQLGTEFSGHEAYKPGWAPS